MAIFNGTAGHDVINGSADADTIEGFAGWDSLYGHGGNDILRGGDDDDYLVGGDGDDTIEGGNGSDGIDDGYGDDHVDGGEGNDRIFSPAGGDDVILAGAGNDYISVTHGQAGDHVVVDAGSGNDHLQLTDYGAGEHIVDMGTGDDFIELNLVKGSTRFTLGEGRDRIGLWDFYVSSLGTGTVAFTDFTPGDAGDRIEYLDFAARYFVNWDRTTNPFASGHVRLLQSGNHAQLQFDMDSGGGNNDYVTVFTFENVSAAGFTAWNLNGYPTDGTIPAGQSLTGTAGADTLHGAGGADSIDALDGTDVLNGGGGNDVLSGGGGFDTINGQTGDDLIYGGGDVDQLNGGYGNDLVYGEGGSDYITSERGSDTLDGGDGDDRFHLAYGSLTLETVTVLGGAGNDEITLVNYGQSTFVVDAGIGADVVAASILAGPAQVTLGEGPDRLLLSSFYTEYLASTGSILVTDFAPGSGDRVDLVDFVTYTFPNWDGSSNPFGNGLMRLLQSGADTLLQIDRSNGGGAWRTIVTFQNIAPSGFTATSLSGFDPAGSPPPGQSITGTPNPDSLHGGGGGDTINGLADNDYIDGKAGNDWLSGGSGHDIMEGGTGNDTLEGEDGNDDLDGGTGDDVIRGGDGNDRIWDDQGSDVIYAGTGNDDITVQRGYYYNTIGVFAEDGNDKISVRLDGGNLAIVDMGGGDDFVMTGPLDGSLTLTLGAGADTVSAADFNLAFNSGDVILTDFNPAEDAFDLQHFMTAYLQGWDEATNPYETGYARLLQRGADTVLQFDPNGGGNSWVGWFDLLGVAANSIGVPAIGYEVHAMFGSGGDETFTYTSPAALAGDTFDGGSGFDRLVLNGQFSGVGFAAGTLLNMERIELLSEPEGGFNGYNLTLANGNVTGGSLLTVSASGLRAGETLVFRGDAVANGRLAVTGGAGNDTIAGGQADDVLDGGDGADQLLLQAGGNDSASGGAGNDVLYFGAAFSAGDVADGGAGRDAVVLQGNVAVTLGSASLVGIESISIQSGANATFGDTANNFYDYSVTTADGNVLPGQQLIVNAQSLRAGEDFTFDGSAESDGRFVVYGGHGVDDLTGGDGVDVFFFEGQRWGASDRVDGGDGRDSLVISAGSGLTRIAFTADSFTNIESISLNNRFATDPSQRPSYELVLHNGNVAPGATLIVNGSSIPGGQLVNIDGRGVHDGNLILFGGGGHDTLFGGAGSDLLIGSGGADALTGGAGADTFRYDSASDSVAGLSDLIGDFQTGTDRIDLSRVDANSNAAGDQAFTWIGANAFSGSAGELRTHDSGGYRWIEGDTDGDGDGDIVIALQIATSPLGQVDFLL